MACPVCLDLMWCAMPELEVSLAEQPTLPLRTIWSQCRHLATRKSPGQVVSSDNTLYASFYLQPFGSVSTMDLLACPEAYPVQAWSMEALHWCQEGTQELVHHRCKAHVLDLMDILESLKWNFCKFKSRLFALSYHGSTPIQLWYQVNEKQNILNIIQRVIFLPAIISKSIFFPAIISENHKWIQRIEIENQNPVAWFRFLV